MFRASSPFSRCLERYLECTRQKKTAGSAICDQGDPEKCNGRAGIRTPGTSTPEGEMVKNKRNAHERGATTVLPLPTGGKAGGIRGTVVERQAVRVRNNVPQSLPQNAVQNARPSANRNIAAKEPRTRQRPAQRLRVGVRARSSGRKKCTTKPFCPTRPASEVMSNRKACSRKKGTQAAYPGSREVRAHGCSRTQKKAPQGRRCVAGGATAGPSPEKVR